MKKIILFIAILAMPFYAHSQNLQAVSTASVNVDATIVAAVTLTKVDDLSFGLVGAGSQTPTITASTGAATNAGPTAQRGVVDFSLTGSTQFTITMTGDDVVGNAVTLFTNAADTSLVATLNFHWEGQGNTAVTLGATQLQTAQDGSQPQPINTGKLFIGGTLNRQGNVPLGNHSSTVTISVDAL
jgi:hypothetical protein